MKKGTLIALAVGCFLTIIVDFILEILFFRHFLADQWLGDSVLKAVFVISSVILVGYSIPGYITAWMGRRGREISTGVTLALVATPLIALLSSFRAPNSMEGFSPTQVLVYLGVATAIVIGSIVRGILSGTYRGENDEIESDSDLEVVEHLAYPG